MLNHLSDLLETWCKSQQLEFISADDLLYQSYNELSISQREWLVKYISIWDATQDFEVDINTNKLETFIPTFHD
ncbi:MAG: hypothetical protein CMB76_09005 [Euryarchaeota archaeon]|nr:hypothetical protein [Euryarchaeota archaeon]|tara:strand:+ start:34 stop:255 length:222 start_codon:yes stop_codon:yes gene_type:complete